MAGGRDQGDDSLGYDQVRCMIIGMVCGLLLAVVYIERDDRIRIISARRATKHEQQEYYDRQTPELWQRRSGPGRRLHPTDRRSHGLGATPYDDGRRNRSEIDRRLATLDEDIKHGIDADVLEAELDRRYP
jgi:hypothetical protein